MRREFISALTQAAENDDRIVLLTGDLGFMVLEPFAERHPARFFNVGVAEQNMVGMATGLAEAGFVPWAYSIATFASMRPYEFIRNGPVLHEFPVRVVGVGGGLDYSHNGITHYALEDIALMRVQPAMTVVAPADGPQTFAAVSAAAGVEGPMYLRLEKEGAEVAGLDDFRLGRVSFLGDGVDLAIVAVGGMVRRASELRDALAENGVHATVAAVTSFNPSPIDDLSDLLARVPVALTLEEHYLSGGVGSLVCEVVAQHGLNCLVVRRGVRSAPRGVSGSRDFFHGLESLTSEALMRTALQALSVESA